MWQKIVDDILQTQELSTAKLAGKVGISKEAVRKLHKGITEEPLYSTGARLLQIHCAYSHEYPEELSNTARLILLNENRKKVMQHFREYSI